MRILLLSAIVVILSAGNLAAQTLAAEGTEGSLSVHVSRREDSSKTWPGGGIGAAWNGSRWALAGEATVTRRDGHNDWHALAGPRVAVVTASRTRVFLQLLAGTLIRQKEARFSAQLGGGVDVSLTPRSAFRILLAGLRDETEAGAMSSARLSVGVVIR